MAGLASKACRTTLSVALGVVTVVTALAISGTPALAQDSPEEIEQRIDEAWRELEPIIEEHNAVRIELDEQRDAAEELAEEIEPMRLQVDLAMAEVSDIAVEAFKGGGDVSAISALLSSGSPYTFAQQLSVLDQVAQGRQQEIADVVEAKDALEAEQADLDVLVAELTAQEAELGEQAGQIEAEIDELQELRTEAYGEGGGLGELQPVPCPTSYPGGDAGTAISFACDQIGLPYVFASAGPDSYDCSGLIKAAWAQVGVILPHNVAQMREVVRSVDRSELQPGDIVFYRGDLSHAGLYAGDGYIVHASQPGQPVHMAPIDVIAIHSYGRPG